ncbi:MAG: choice-of-anchor B family protein, partial [Bacteroidota bacterium]
GSSDYVHFIDLRIPTEPTEIARFEGGNTTNWRDMKTYGDVAYAVSDNTVEGLLVFDLSLLPDTVLQVGQYQDVFLRAHNIYIDEANARLYVVGTDTERNGVIIYDLSCDPRRPEFLASISTLPEGYIHDIYVRDNIAYASHGFSGYAVWDFNDVEQPVKLATLETGGYNHSSWVTEDGEYAVFAEEIPQGEPLGIIDLRDMMDGDIEIVQKFAFPLLAPDFTDATPHNPYVRGHHVISSYYEDGIHVYDISDPLQPREVAYYDTYPDNEEYTGYNGNWGAYPYLPSGILLASDRTYGLFVLRADNVSFSEVTPFNQVDVQLAQQDTLLCSESPLLLSSVAQFDTYQWMFEGMPIEGAIQATYTATGSGSYALQASRGNCSGISCEVLVGRYETPEFILVEVPEIPEDSTQISTDVEATNFQWFLDGEPIAAPDTNTISIFDYIPAVNGTFEFSATAIDANGCFITSENTLSFSFISSTTSFDEQVHINLYPTVVTDKMYIEVDGADGQMYSIQLLGTDGQLLHEGQIANGSNTVCLPSLGSGVYLVRIFNQNGHWIRRMIRP